MLTVGLLKPTTFVWRPFRSMLEVFRCATDGGIVLNTQYYLRLHAGHRLHQPVMLSVIELVGIWVGLIR